MKQVSFKPRVKVREKVMDEQSGESKVGSDKSGIEKLVPV